MGDPEDLQEGLTAYRAGRYFEAHERWEERWRAEADPAERLLLQALVQLAAALHKLTTGIRPRGAPALLARSEAKLARLADGGARPFGLDPRDLHARLRRFAGSEPTPADVQAGRLQPPVL